MSKQQEFHENSEHISVGIHVFRDDAETEETTMLRISAGDPSDMISRICSWHG